MTAVGASAKRDPTADAAPDQTHDPSPDPGAIGAPRLHLRLIATSDLHASLLPYDYCADKPAAGVGLGGVALQIARARAEVPDSLLLDNGDFLQGSPMADFVASSGRRRRDHPVITAFNTLGYDAVTLGNHEFDYGIGFLEKALAQARFPVVSANVATRLGPLPVQDQTLVPPYAILQRRLVDQFGVPHGLRIGVIGFAPPMGEMSDPDQVRVRDIMEAARAWLPRLRAAGVDVIIALAHSGIGSGNVQPGMEHASAALAALPEIDAVIAGHSHQIFPAPGTQAQPGIDPERGLLAGKPAVMPGHSGSHVGIIDLHLERAQAGDRRWRIVATRSRLTPQAASADRPQAPDLRSAIAPDHRATLAWSRRVLGETRVPLTSHFATVAPNAALALIAEAKLAHVRRRLAGTGWEGVPLVAAAAPYRAGGHAGTSAFTDIAAGPFRMRNLSDLYTFPNRLVTLALRGADLADWLERAAILFQQVQPGQADAPLHDPAIPGYVFETIPGLDFAIDLTQPPRFALDGQLIHPMARRIVGLRLQGRPLDPAEPVLLATNNHRAARFVTALGDRPVVALAEGTRVQAVIAEHIRAQGVVGAAPRRNWHFLPMPGTTVRLRTGAGAAAALGEVAHMRPELIERDQTGCLHYRLHL